MATSEFIAYKILLLEKNTDRQEASVTTRRALARPRGGRASARIAVSEAKPKDFPKNRILRE